MADPCFRTRIRNSLELYGNLGYFPSTWQFNYFSRGSLIIAPPVSWPGLARPPGTFFGFARMTQERICSSTYDSYASEVVADRSPDYPALDARHCGAVPGGALD